MLSMVPETGQASSRNATVSIKLGPLPPPPGVDHALNLSHPQEALIWSMGLLFKAYGFLTIYVQSFLTIKYINNTNKIITAQLDIIINKIRI